MPVRKQMSLVFTGVVAPGGFAPVRPIDNESDIGLEVAVVFTSTDATLAALRKAGALAKSLRARITLVVPQIVPYPLPLNSPPVLLDFTERRFEAIARNSLVETVVRIYLCRDGFRLLQDVLKPGAVVVLGGRHRWWPTAGKSLARKLRRAGYEVIFAEMN